MKIAAARVISIIGHPFVLLSLLVLWSQLRTNPERAIPGTIAFGLIVLIPLGLFIWRARASGRWQTVDASNKADRPTFYLAMGIVMVVAGIYFQFIEQSPSFVRGCLVVGAMMLLAFVLNRWIKLSLHVAFAVFVGLLLLRFEARWGVPILIFVPLLIWSRLVLARHVPSETIGGMILGSLGAVYLIWS